MKFKKKVLIVFGTRPEAIKMAPLVRELSSHQELDVKVCVTGQHRSMLDQVLEIFEITPDFDLNLMSNAQSLEGISALILTALTKILNNLEPDLVLVHGDTTTTSMASLACFYKKIAIGHIEAGLRTGDIWSPWPEELNRRITGLISTLHFAPTKLAATNLLEEGVDSGAIEITGNTVIDALLHITHRLRVEDTMSAPLRERFEYLSDDKRIILVTGHRRENFGDGMIEICNALNEVSKRKDVQIVYAVHMNPNVKEPVESMLSNRDNIFLIPPQDYLSFVYLMMKSFMILTDSGGIQEEAPSLGKPVLVMRETTERPEAIDMGTARLVGTKHTAIVQEIFNLLDNPDAYNAMANISNPYGDGRASERIVDRIVKYFNGNN